MNTSENQKIPRPEDSLAFEAPEHEIKKKGLDWFFAVGIITISIVISSIIYQNYLFAILILIGVFTLILFSLKEAATIHIKLTPRNILVDDKKYSYKTLDSFWITENDYTASKILIQSKNLLLGQLVIPLGENDPDKISEYLLAYLPEKEDHEPLSHQVMEYLGF